MIRLRKRAKPEILERNEEIWTREYVAGLQDGLLSDTKRYRYRHKDIKAAVKAETYEKCAYCESRTSHVHPGEIDHILPRSRKPTLVVKWENLTYVCTECNRRKLDYYSEAEPLVNPYIDEPADHLRFVGPLVLHRDNKGLRTTKQIGLSRTELVERRQEEIEQLNLLIQKWQEMSEGPTKEFLRQEIDERAAPIAEFSAAVDAFLANIQEFAEVTGARG